MVKSPIPIDIVFTQNPPDIDGIACAVAYAELRTNMRKPSLPWCPGETDGEAAYVLSLCPDIVFATPEDVRLSKWCVLVDGCELEAVPSLIDPAMVGEVIDHRLHHNASSAFPNAELCIEAVGAAATLIVERFRAEGRLPSRSSGVLLYAAVQSNTQRLRGSITTERDIAASLWLEEAVEIPPNLVTGQFAARRDQILADLQGAICKETKAFGDGPRRYVIAQLEMAGAEELWATRSDEILTAMMKLGSRTMLNLVDVAGEKSILIVPDETFRAEVVLRTGFVFSGSRTDCSPIILRKQIFAAMEGIGWER